MLEKLSGIEDRYEELNRSLLEVGDDYQRAAELNMERVELEPLVKKAGQYRQALDQLDDARTLLASDDDDVVVEPGLVDFSPGRLVHRLHVDACDLGADLLTHQANFHRLAPSDQRYLLLERGALRYRADARMVRRPSAGVNKTGRR